MTPATPAEIADMSATVYGEARGSTQEDREMVASVLVNRAAAAKQFVAKRGKPHPLFGDGTLSKACRAPWQFSCWNPGDPNSDKVHACASPKGFDTALANDAAFQACVRAVKDVLNGKTVPIAGALFYHTTKMGWPGAWGDRKPAKGVVGAHTFYGDINAA